MIGELEKIARFHGAMNLKKQRKKRQKLIIKDLCVDYARNSTLHGLRYVTASGLTLIEKLFWMSTFFMSVALCGYLIGNVYHKWTTSPVIVSVSEKLVSVGSVPFPSVTICPQTKSNPFHLSMIEELVLMYKNDKPGGKFNKSELYLYRLHDISQVCKYNSKKFRSNRNFTDVNILKNIMYLAPKIFDIFVSCYWQNNKQNCYIFKEDLTADGVCFNMNGVATSELLRNVTFMNHTQGIRGWSMEKGYSDLENDPFPIRGNRNHASPDLEIYLRSSETDRDPLCNGLKSGFEIYLHHPADYPQSSLYHYSAVVGVVTTLAVSVHAQSTSDSLAQYSPEVRQCYFQSDRYLRYFQNYTTKNCEAECLSNYTQEHCGCVGFYMPHDNSHLFCAENKMDCMRQAFDKMVMKEQRLELGLDLPESGCRCLPACNSVEYDAEVLRTAFFTENFEGKSRCFHYGISSHCFDYNISKVEIYFKKSQFMSFHRSELFGTTDFLANIGGLLGLFLGFSFLSLVEILYFITLRLGLAIRRNNAGGKNIRLENNQKKQNIKTIS